MFNSYNTVEFYKLTKKEKKERDAVMAEALESSKRYNSACERVWQFNEKLIAAHKGKA
jgi:hypothetical protein